MEPVKELEPLLLVGAARSGTTLLGETVLASHPEVVYAAEPVFVWRYGAAWRRHDVRTAADATPRVKAYIWRWFQELAADAPGTVIVDKTPENCLRLPFALEVFPRARVVHVIRDGRDVAVSAAREWRGLGASALDSPGLRKGGAVKRTLVGVRRWSRLGERVRDLRSLLELPAYLGRLVGYVVRQTLHPGWVVWGPRFPGIRRVRRQRSLVETCAIQWQWCVGSATAVAEELGGDRYLEVRYEELVADPQPVVRRILGFAELEATDRLVESLTSGIVAGGGASSWRQDLSDDEVRRIETLVGGTLEELGYPLRGTGHSGQGG